MHKKLKEKKNSDVIKQQLIHFILLSFFQKKDKSPLPKSLYKKNSYHHHQIDSTSCSKFKIH